jgi:hypothetical protein
MVYTNGQVPSADELNNFTPNTVTFSGTSSAPSTVEGKMYYDTDDATVRVYNGASWVGVAEVIPPTNYDNWQTYSDGDNISTSTWDVTLSATQGAATAKVESLGTSFFSGEDANDTNMGEIDATTAGAITNGQIQTAQITSKSLTKQNMFFRYQMYTMRGDSSGNQAYIYLQFGNVTDGYTSVKTQTEARNTTTTTTGSCIVRYVGSNQYTIYGTPGKVTLTKANGLNLRVVCSTAFNTYHAEARFRMTELRITP